ncbi:glyoxalase [Sinomicrobium weinanense]|uniref:Glyoxalase n=1 Tax=Sinomicrobium weinanense TaxID=2842200 RepID=A0A926Q450_9FLAO|nr:glyoxalase [Sinomicrobium weinanense]MBC9798248.1 glyoxalase [Sinomicrobium weinanense]MBU3122647.1 glyoxalase [Sinomicrobium weinanense]
MDIRTKDLLHIRPEIPNALVYEEMSSDERFQNVTIRPVIKLQGELLVEAFRNYANKHKGVFYTLTLEKRLEYIENAIQKDIKFRNSLKGMIIGQFTVEEYLTYIENSSALNKRMMGMVIETIKDRVQLLDVSVAV